MDSTGGWTLALSHRPTFCFSDEEDDTFGHRAHLWENNVIVCIETSE